MKLLYCEQCGDLVVPSGTPKQARLCRCTRACIWWEDPAAGKLVVYSVSGPSSVSVIGLHNGLLTEPFHSHREPSTEGGCERRLIPGDTIARLIDETPGSYLFKQVQSLVIRIRPGYSSDTRFAGEEEAAPVYAKAARLP